MQKTIAFFWNAVQHSGKSKGVGVGGPRPRLESQPQPLETETVAWKVRRWRGQAVIHEAAVMPVLEDYGGA